MGWIHTEILYSIHCWQLFILDWSSSSDPAFPTWSDPVWIACSDDKWICNNCWFCPWCIYLLWGPCNASLVSLCDECSRSPCSFKIGLSWNRSTKNKGDKRYQSWKGVTANCFMFKYINTHLYKFVHIWFYLAIRGRCLDIKGFLLIVWNYRELDTSSP